MRRAAPFQRSENGVYYFRYTDENGKHHEYSTKTNNYDDALLVIKSFNYQRNYFKKAVFREEVRQYQKVESNPKYKISKQTGSCYSHRYAIGITYKAKKLEEIVTKYCPEYLMMPLEDFRRRDINIIVDAIVKEQGYTRTAQKTQQFLKVVFSQAYQDGIIETSPAQGQKVIYCKEKKRYAIPFEWLSWVISRKDLFLNEEYWAYFTVAATTGMRRSEILALSTEQINGDVLVINRSMGGTGRDSEVTLPKFNIIRTIKLSKITLDALNTLTPIKGRYFYHNDSWVDDIFSSLKATLNGLDKEDEEHWGNLTSHILRHSLNTNLVVSGCDATLIAEYLGWQHQGKLLDMQARYTHFVAQHLTPIAEKIDELYSPKVAQMQIC